MRDYFKTIEEARKYRYNVWAGNSKGHAYREGYCAEPVYTVGRAWVQYQCSKKNGHGPDGLYCKQHSLGKGGGKTKTWYSAPNKWGWDIETVEVEKESEQSIFINGRRVAKKSEHTSYYPTFGEARAALVGRAQSKIIFLKSELLETENELSKLKALISPEAK